MALTDDCAARDLESRELYRAAAELRALSGEPLVVAELDCATRDAEAVGDWRRWAELLELRAGVPAGPGC